MAIKKSQLYSSLWASCDELRGGMDASQYKDYVLVLLFIKYVSDKYAGVPYAPIVIPKGAGFADMVAFKGKPDIGDQINKKIIAPLFNANRLSDYPDFNDANKLSSGKEMVERLTHLIAIFEDPALDFSKQRAGDDDLLGDAYEYLMRHFATESGKSKGQFYTPAEVSRVIAKVIGIREANTTPATTIYDPTCGSGSLLLRVADEARVKPTIFGQEKDSTTAGLARMNMILHGSAGADIVPGNTLTGPRFLDGGQLRQFDYVVANPPFSDKRWSTGLDPTGDPFGRFEGFGVPPAKQGDYAYLLHIVRSLRQTGTGACVMPHGVLFRGNAEAAIRKNLIRRGYLKGIIGLPANLFYGTGIPACIIVLDKQHATERRGIFMVDASAGCMKDGPKNRLRERDIHRIVDAFQSLRDVPKYARMVPYAEIEKNDFNLNLPRYIDSRPPEDLQDINAHLNGGIPEADVAALEQYWAICPGLRDALFKPGNPSSSAGTGAGVKVRYYDLTVPGTEIKTAIQNHPQFRAFVEAAGKHYQAWRERTAQKLKALQAGFAPRELLGELSDDLLAHYRGQPLTDAYAVYQHLMDYAAETLRDDLYLIAADGWQARAERITGKDRKGKKKDKGWACDLVPKSLVIARYFATEQAALDALQAELGNIEARLGELEEAHGGEDGAFSDFDKINAKSVKQRLDENFPSPSFPRKQVSSSKLPSRLRPGPNSSSSFPWKRESSSISPPRLRPGPDSSSLDSDTGEATILQTWLDLDTQCTAVKKRIKQADAELEAAAYAKYPQLTEADIEQLVVDDKWLAALATAIRGETERAGQALTRRVKELAERYAAPLPQLETRVSDLQAKVAAHLKKMGFAWT